MRGQRPLRGVEGVDDDLVQPQVAAQRELVGLVDVDRMSVLPFPFVLLERRCLAELAVRFDGDANAASARVVGGEYVFARLINDEMARRPAL